MAVNRDNFTGIIAELKAKNAQLVAVSKTKSAEDILAVYHLGQRDFGENYVQELVEKEARLPKDIRWHFIGHLQTNKVKIIAPFIHLIQGVDSRRLLTEINKQAQKRHRRIEVLLQIHIAREDTKFGLNEGEVHEILDTSAADLKNIRINGFMGMASFTEDKERVRQEFRYLKGLYDRYRHSSSLALLSMGMSGDYTIALEEGSNMIRIGSLLFGERT